MKLAEIDTPSLVIDIETVEKNIRAMRQFLATKKTKLRAHTKIHKSPFLAHMQIAGGSSGITCAKVGEAEVMVQAGISDILIANEIVGRKKTGCLANLARFCDLKVAVDDLDNANDISRAAGEAGSEIGVLVDVNLSSGGSFGDKNLGGMLNRCGVSPGKAAVELAVAISKLPNLRLKGVMGYEGGLPEYPSREQSDAVARESIQLLVRSKEAIQDRGIDAETVSCGSSTSYKVAAGVPGVTELQAGSYILMDTYHHRFSPEFDYALWVEAQVVSVPNPRRAIVDAGGTAISGDAGLPQLRVARPDLKVIELNAEHIHLEMEPNTLHRGDRVQLVPSNIDTTTCLHDNYVVTRKGEVEMLLPVAARGKFH